MRVIPLIILSLIYCSHSLAADSLTTEDIAVTGVVLEKGSKKPIKHATLFIKEKGVSVSTDKKGTFSFKIPLGTYTVIIPVMGYEKLEKSIVVSKKRHQYKFWVEPHLLNPYKIVVKAKREKTEVSSHKIDKQEALVMPGANRDVINVVTNLPGVNSLSVFNGYGSGLVIRGSAPEDSAMHVNDHWVPMLYHFGGLESVFEPEMVDSVDYYAGGFGPEFLEATGGVIKVNVRDPRKDRFGGYLNLSFLSASTMIEGPITDKDSICLSVKRGFLDAYSSMISQYLEDESAFELTTYPSYYDGSFIWTHEFGPKSKLKMIGIGAKDKMELVYEEEVADRFSDTLGYQTRFAHIITEWHFKSGRFRSVFSPMIAYDQSAFDMGPRTYFHTTTRQLSLSEKMRYQLDKDHNLEAGARFVAGKLDIDANLFAMEKEGEISDNQFVDEIDDSQDIAYNVPTFYLKDIFTVKAVTVTTGFHALYDHHNENYYIDPRLAMKYALTSKWLIKGATGLYSKMPEEDESYPPWGTKGLEPEHSIHTIGGIEYQFTKDILFDLQGYYKHFYNSVVRPDEDDPTIYSNDGKGYAYGAEMLLRHDMTDNFFGWISYSYTVSKRKDGDHAKWRYFDMDITHNLTAICSYKFNKFWQVGSRFKYSSHPPYTDLLNVETIYDVDNNVYIPLYDGPINNKRLPDHHQLDVRIDKYWLFNQFIVSTYLDIQNIYMNDHVVQVGYNEDYTQKEDMTTLPILVFVGVKIDY